MSRWRRAQVLLTLRCRWTLDESRGLAPCRSLRTIHYPLTCASTGKSAFPRCFASAGVQRSDPSSSKQKEQKAIRFQSIPGVEDTVVGEYVQSSDFLKCSVYLRDALGISSSLAERITIKLAFWGFTSDGQAYVRQFPSPLLLEGSIKLMVESLSNIPGIDLKRVAQNSPFVFIQSPVARYRMQDNLEWLKSSFFLQQDEVGKVLNGNAYILTQPRERNSEPAVSFLKSLNLDEDQLRTVVLRYPRLLSLRVQKLKRTLEKLNELGFDKALAEGIISRFPAVCEWDFFKLVSDLVKIPTPDVFAILYKEVSLTCTIFNLIDAVSLSEEKVDGVFSWLSSTVGLNARDIITVIHRFPNLLSYSISDNLQPSLNYLKEEMKLDNKSIQNSILYAPDILARRSELLAVHAASAREAGISSSDFASIVKAYPGILRLNLMSNLHRAKLRFLEEELGRDVSPALATNPMYVTYSLPRIVTRAAFLKKNKRSSNALTSWLSCKDDVFAKRFAGTSLQDWYRFRYEWLSSPQARKWLG